MIKNQKILFFISLLLLNNSIGFAQLVINNTYTPTQLVQNILVGSGVTVSNISYTTGGAKSIGAFTNGVTTNLGLNSGIVLCTGYDSLIPNPATYFMSNSLGLPGDVDIDSISHQAQTYDACVLQFDFIPLSDTVKFRYVFGSEEYPKYVCSKYFDSFGFFVSGPGIAGPYSNNSINIALIPGTNFPVGINSVNNGTIGSGAGGGNCTGVGQSLAYKNYYVDNAALNGTTICFGGFTTPLTASCAVTPCKTYHVKLAVGEASNGLFDSGVFLEANSFSSPTYKVATSYSNSSSGNAAMEGCSSGIFSFTLPSATSSPYTIHYTIAGTATNGTDYPTIPDSITIPAGQDSAAIVITPILDGITEGKETVILNYTVGCTNLSDTVFIIDDIPLIPVASGDTIICPGNSATLLVSTTGGTIPYTYNWSNGAGTGTSATVTPASTTNYVITVTDKCGQTATDTATVTVAISPNVSITPLNPSICPGDSVLLTASSASAVSYSWSPSTGLSATTGAVVVANPTTSTTYIVTVYSANNCSATASVTVTISNNISVNVTPINPTICLNSSITLTATGNAANYTWSPSSGLSDTTGASVTANPTTSITYVVIGTSGSCSGSTSVTVNVISISATATSTNENCGQSNGSATATPSGNCNQSWTYAWNTTPVQQTSQTATHLSAGIYTVTIHCGACIATATDTIIDLPGPSVSIITATNTTCGNANGGAVANATFGNGPYTYKWSNGQTGTNLTNVIAGTYTVTATDANNCMAMNSVTLTNIAGPTASITATIASDCGMSDGSATLTVAGGTQPYTFIWNSTPAQSSQNLTNVLAGNYCVTVTDSNGCIISACETIGQNPGPTVTASSTADVCGKGNGTTTATASGGMGQYTYLWSNNATTSVVSGLETGTYTVSISDGGCSASTSIFVGEIPGPIAGFIIHPKLVSVLNNQVYFADNSTGSIISWDWSLGDGYSEYVTNFTHDYINVGSYPVTLIVTDTNGCKDEITDTVKVKDIFTFYIPNAFTPNDDELNDGFTPQGTNVDPNNFEMYIFDRWGNLMFHTTKWYVTSAEPWNGTLNNSGKFDDAIMDTYVYKIVLKEIEGLTHQYIGRITIVQ